MTSIARTMTTLALFTAVGCGGSIDEPPEPFAFVDAEGTHVGPIEADGSFTLEYSGPMPEGLTAENADTYVDAESAKHYVRRLVVEGSDHEVIMPMVGAARYHRPERIAITGSDGELVRRFCCAWFCGGAPELCVVVQ